MSSIKLILRENKVNKSGEMPLYIRIIKDRKTKFISIGTYLLPHQWDATQNRVVKHKNSARLNNFIAQKLADAHNLALEMETKNKYISSRRMKDKIMGKASISFTDYAYAFRDRLERDNKIGSHQKAKTVLQKLDDYTHNIKLSFGEIDVQFLKAYEKYLRDDLKNSTNTIHSNLKLIRKLFNDAIRDEIIEPNLNPFIKYKLKLEKTTKEYLTEEELTKIENAKFPEDSIVFHHRNAYVFAAYAGGIRISDLLQLKWSNYNGTNITWQVHKTKDMLSVKLPAKAKEILSYYEGITKEEKRDTYIFPFLNNDKEQTPESLFKDLSSKNSYANTSLKEIVLIAKVKKKISFHSSRHTWATRALRKGMRIEYVSKLMGHSSIKTTQIYSKIVNSELDNAMDIFDD